MRDEYIQSEQIMSRKQEAFDVIAQKIGGLSALADCVADATENIQVAANDFRNLPKYEKLVDLAYLLSESMESLKEYVSMV